MMTSMRFDANRLKALALSVFALSVAGYGGQAMADVLPVQNLTFTDFGPGGLPPKTMFVLANAVGWSGPAPWLNLVAIDAPGHGDCKLAAGPIHMPFAVLSLTRRPVEISSRWTAIRPLRIRSTRSSTA